MSYYLFYLDLEILHQILTESYKELTKWEVYQAELDSGQLKWGILHSEQFFKANARKMEGTKGDFCHVKRLIQLVTNIEHDEETVAIACFDLGEFIRQYPNGKAIAKRLGCKEVIMPLLSHESLEIQRHALQCISKLLVNNWEAAIRNSAS
jgi:V-type H+-transporting ATPase subunit H